MDRSPAFWCRRLSVSGRSGHPSLGASARSAKRPPPHQLPSLSGSLASRLSYFLWSSMPDEELLSHAKTGDLGKPAVLAAQVSRMLKDGRARGLATEFGAIGWTSAVLRATTRWIASASRVLRTNCVRPMFEEPIRFITDLIQNDRPVLNLLYGNYTLSIALWPNTTACRQPPVVRTNGSG